MTPLFYDKTFVLNANTHGALRLRSEVGFAFARHAVAVPLTLEEFPLAARSFPICFASRTGQPLAILGVKEGQNLFVDAAGAWKAGAYVPAYLRRYPFILVEAEADQVLLAMQDDAEVLDPAGGTALFEDGRPTAQALAAFEFCRSYLTGVRRTEAWIKALQDQDLLVERKADFQPNVGEPSTVRGFSIVDPDRLRALDGAVLGDWNRQDWLAPLFAHISSMALWPELFELSAQAGAPGAEPMTVRPKAKRAKLN